MLSPSWYVSSSSATSARVGELGHEQRARHLADERFEPREVRCCSVVVPEVDARHWVGKPQCADQRVVGRVRGVEDPLEVVIPRCTADGSPLPARA